MILRTILCRDNIKAWEVPDGRNRKLPAIGQPSLTRELPGWFLYGNGAEARRSLSLFCFEQEVSRPAQS
jgi:hypothetical protein